MHSSKQHEDFNFFSNGSGDLRQVSSFPTDLSDITNSWALGLMSIMHPAAVMKELFRVLRIANMEWKVVGPYQIRSRFKTIATSIKIDGTVPTPSDPLKLGFQLFSLGHKKYLLDVKKLSGDTNTFFGICSTLLKELHL
jgi:hypothetical protein